MKCPNCNQDLPDNAKACPACGTSFINDKSELNASQIAAQADLKTKQSEGVLIPALALGFGLIFLLFGFVTKVAIIIGIGLMAAGIYALYVRNKRLSELKKISDGAVAISVCPQCKSQNIEMGLVNTGSTTYMGRTTISDNINPLTPFTHTNINHGNSITTNNYKNKCHCLNCGNVFNKPQIVYK